MTLEDGAHGYPAEQRPHGCSWQHRGFTAVTWQSLWHNPPTLVCVEGGMEGGRLQTLVLPQAGAQCPLHPFLLSKWHWETTHQGSPSHHEDVMYLVWGSSAPSQCLVGMGDMRMMKASVWFWFLCCFLVCPCVLSFYSQLRLESVLSDLLDTGSFQRGGSWELTQSRSPTR